MSREWRRPTGYCVSNAGTCVNNEEDTTISCPCNFIVNVGVQTFVDQVEHGRQIPGVTAKHVSYHLRKAHPLANVKQIHQERLPAAVNVPVQAPVVAMVTMILTMILLQPGGDPQVFEQLVKLKQRQAKPKVAVVGVWYI